MGIFRGSSPDGPFLPVDNYSENAGQYKLLLYRPTDGAFEESGLDGVKRLMEEDYVQKNARDRVHAALRKHKEKPRWWFRRFQLHLKEVQRYDLDFRLAKCELADIYLHHSDPESR